MVAVQENVLKDKKEKEYISLSAAKGALSCCGLSEFICLELQKYYQTYHEKLTDKEWQELVAKYLKHGILYEDKRIVIIGIPVRVGTNSIYDITFYDKLRDTLEDFGFKQVGAKYKNSNSQNTIVAMVGQLP